MVFTKIDGVKVRLEKGHIVESIKKRGKKVCFGIHANGIDCRIYTDAGKLKT